MIFRSLYEKWLNSIFNNKKIKNPNDLFRLDCLIDFWQQELLGRCQRLFVWENLPFPQREMENLLLFNGFASVVEDRKFLVNKIAVVPCTYSGVTEYPDIGKLVTWTTPVASGNFNMINGKGVFIRNNSLCRSLMPFINRYAIMLANVDMSLICALVNERSQSVIVADTQNTADSINTFYKNIEEYGKRKAVVNEKLFEALQGAIALPTVANKETIKPILECYDAIMQMFYNDIGIRYNKDKKERMISNEITSDSQRLLININDMLESRKEASKEINREFGLNTSVELSNEIVLSENNKLTTDNKSSQLDEEPQTAEEQKENVDYSF